MDNLGARSYLDGLFQWSGGLRPTIKKYHYGL